MSTSKTIISGHRIGILQGLKKVMRSTITKKLKVLSDQELKKQSELVHKRLLSTSIVNDSKSISIYINMPTGELLTDQLLLDLFELKKNIFIPRVDGMFSDDMRMLRLKSVEEMSQFVNSKWHIKEPTIHAASKMENALDSGVVDLVIVPGVAFDKQCHRLGHGKGYYDCFLRKLQTVRKEKNLPPAFTVGLSLSDQVVNEVPIMDHDVALDFVITPNKIFTSTSTTRRESLKGTG